MKMKKQKWLTICIALALAAVMLWAVPSLAQMHGRGGPWGQGWGCWQGQGQGQGQGQYRGAGYAAYCPNYSGYQYYRGNRGYWGNNPQANTGSRGPMRGGRNYQPNTQPTPPPATQ
jgi:hypothetical protein